MVLNITYTYILFTMAKMLLFSEFNNVWCSINLMLTHFNHTFATGKIFLYARYKIFLFADTSFEDLNCE